MKRFMWTAMVVAFVCGGSFSAEDSVLVSPPFFGLDINHLPKTPWPSVPFGSLRLWDAGVMWANLNPSKGVYNWSSLDQLLSMAEANHVSVLYCFGGTPAWALAAGLSIRSVSRKANVVTVVMDGLHGLYFSPIASATRQSQITVSGISDSSFNGTFYLTGAPSPRELTYTQTGPDGHSSGGTVHTVCGGPYAPHGACAEAPVDLRDWDVFVTALGKHVAGKITYWEIWNEANLDQFWRGDPKTLVAMAKQARDILKTLDPSAVILSPSTTVNFTNQKTCDTYDKRCGSAWMSRWLSEGGRDAIDVVAFHGYPSNAPPEGESPEQIAGQTELQRQAIAKNGAGLLPLWDTESSWGEAKRLPDPDNQAAWLARHYLLEASQGVVRSFWYSWDNASWGGLWDPVKGILPAGVAYGEIYHWLVNAKVGPCVADTAGVWTCPVTYSDGRAALAVWSPAGPHVYAPDASYRDYRDLAAHVSEIKGSSVPVNVQPILLEKAPAS